MAKARRNAHPQDIMAEVRKKVGSMAALAKQSGLSRTTIQNAIHRPQPTGNRIIASLLGKPVQELWPEWFDEHGNRRIYRNQDTLSRPRSQRQNGEAA